MQSSTRAMRLSSVASPRSVVGPRQSVRRPARPVRAFKEASSSSSSSSSKRGDVATSSSSSSPSSSSSSANNVVPLPASASTSIPIPSSIFDVDNGRILGFGAELAPDHPGFHDDAYKLRRAQLATEAKLHVPGTPPPLVAYSEEETKVWTSVFDRVSLLYPRAACPEFLSSLPRLNFARDRVPQLADASEVLQKTTGWAVRPVAGLMHPRDFFAGLAFRTFHSTSYMRHPSRPSYTPEPDVCHELLGHVPMLSNAEFAEMARAIGVASLGADEARLWHLTKLYWFTVEFGVVESSESKSESSSPSSSSPSSSSLSSSSSSNKIPKAFGAGILSSFGEMEHLLSGEGYTVEKLDPFAPQPKMSYKDGYQKRFFELESFAAGKELLLEYCAATTPLDIRQRFGLLEGAASGQAASAGRGGGGAKK